ncbi:cytochrome c, class I [Deinococcus phoenicis]|uniref:Cytochrome c, class I n=1 Tax=Deinococcus phoenicis TaxID=1476583 RepID=A0A016QTT2_9DEIO|nr:cytochrome c [Deinococcus phoenicis]EYB69406.1 cytochrome c, class I [Deinococcus phoenicis]
MSSERAFTSREVAGILTFAALAAATAILSYRAGIGMSGGAGGAEMAAPVAAAPVNGQALYASNCAGCHGGQAQGGVGPALGVTKSWADAAFKEAVLHGKAEGRELAPVMPRFADTGLDGAPATDEQVTAIHAYLKGL